MCVCGAALEAGGEALLLRAPFEGAMFFSCNRARTEAHTQRVRSFIQLLFKLLAVTNASSTLPHAPASANTLRKQSRPHRCPHGGVRGRAAAY